MRHALYAIVNQFCQFQQHAIVNSSISTAVDYLIYYDCGLLCVCVARDCLKVCYMHDPVPPAGMSSASIGPSSPLRLW